MVQNAIATALRNAPDLRPALADKPDKNSFQEKSSPTFLAPRSNWTHVDSNLEGAPQISDWEKTLQETATAFSPAKETEFTEWKPILGERPVVTKILGQVHGTFILAETEEGYVVIDQHAAHEKVQYESLRENLESAKTVSQRLLLDEMLNLNPRQLSVYEENKEFLKKIGFFRYGESSLQNAKKYFANKKLLLNSNID